MQMALDYKLIGKRLKQARLEKNITQEHIAEILDVSSTYISRIETGSTKINLKRIYEICNILEADEAKIISGTSDTSTNYMSADFNDLLKNCPTEKLKLIYKIAKTIIENE